MVSVQELRRRWTVVVARRWVLVGLILAAAVGSGYLLYLTLRSPVAGDITDCSLTPQGPVAMVHVRTDRMSLGSRTCGWSTTWTAPALV